MPLTAAEVVDYPGFDHVIWDLPPTKKGKLAVAKDRCGPFDIAYEVHGRGPVHLVAENEEQWVMGLGALKWFWQRQTKDFGHDQALKYSCLIFDNRGMGESDKPLLRYSTSEMAKDALEVVDHLGWIAERELHVVGISMGGMIAQEMAYLKPQRIASLSLISTAAQLINTIGYFEHLRRRIEIFMPKSLDAQLAEIKSRVSITWLSEPDTDGEFPTNGDRFAAQELKKRQDTEGFTRKGFLCQAIAVGWHRKTADQLRQMAEQVGRRRIQVMHGTIDNLITFPHAAILVEALGGEKAGITNIVFPDRGHYLPLEERQEFRRLIKAMVDKTEAL